MSRNLRMYYYAVLGAIGGLVGWRLTDLGDLLPRSGMGIYATDLLQGAALGLAIGFTIGLAEGIFSRSILRGLRAAAISGGIGLLAGAIALPLSEFVFNIVGAKVPGRALGWAIFGALVGLSDGITSGSQMWKGSLGGLIGGAIGGVLLELVFAQLRDSLLGKVTGLMVLGASIGIFTALIVVALSRAWLEVRSGKLQGTEFILDKFLAEKSHAAIIGSNVMKSDIAIPDPDAAPQHARLKGAGTYFSLQDMSIGKGTFVNGKKIEKHRLSDRETIRIGSTEIVYHEKR
jgi:hypothetical protein